MTNQRISRQDWLCFAKGLAGLILTPLAIWLALVGMALAGPR